MVGEDRERLAVAVPAGVALAWAEPVGPGSPLVAPVRSIVVVLIVGLAPWRLHRRDAQTTLAQLAVCSGRCIPAGGGVRGTAVSAGDAGRVAPRRALDGEERQDRQDRTFHRIPSSLAVAVLVPLDRREMG